MDNSRASSQRTQLTFLLIGMAMLFSILACARSDIPPPRGIGSGGIQPTSISSPEQIQQVEQPQSSETLLPESTATETVQGPDPVRSPTFPATPTHSLASSGETIVYRAGAGDTLRSVAARFGVLPSDITSSEGPLPDEESLIDPEIILLIPRRLGVTGPSDLLIPDSELIFSPHAADFDIESFVESQGGYLGRYREIIGKRWRNGAEVVAIVARDNSINPRILLAFLEHYAGWVTDPTLPDSTELKYPLGHTDPQTQGLFRQLIWLANELGVGYYEWKAGKLLELMFSDSSIVRLAPELNAGTIAIQRFFGTLMMGRAWAETVSNTGFIATYLSLFGDPFEYQHPLYAAELEQPEMILPFFAGRVWAYTGGPHGAWERESAWAALDFAPPSIINGCFPSEEWVVASAPGLVVRSGAGVVVLDLDGDGREQTGWNILYLHIASQSRVEEGELVEQGDLIGHPSCEGGIATGTHLHMARKYNGEWILADGPLSFNLGGWIAREGTKAYQGALISADGVVLACACASSETYISR